MILPSHGSDPQSRKPFVLALNVRWRPPASIRCPRSGAAAEWIFTGHEAHSCHRPQANLPLTALARPARCAHLLWHLWQGASEAAVTGTAPCVADSTSPHAVRLILVKSQTYSIPTLLSFYNTVLYTQMLYRTIECFNKILEEIFIWFFPNIALCGSGLLLLGFYTGALEQLCIPILDSRNWRGKRHIHDRPHIYWLKNFSPYVDLLNSLNPLETELPKE